MTRITKLLAWAFLQSLLLQGTVFCIETTFITDPKTGKKVEVASDQIIVKYRTGVSAARRAALRFSSGVRSSREITGLNAETLKVSSSSLLETLQNFRASPEVESAEPDYVRKLTGVTFNDTYFSQQYALTQLQITDAWGVTTGTGLAEVKVAVLDSGVDYNHDDLGGAFRVKVYDGFDFFNDDADPMDDDGSGIGHGTAVAGIIAATANNGIGIAGIHNNAKILAVKVCSDDCLDSHIILGVDYAIAKGVNIMNMSFGGASGSSILQDAIDRALAERITVVASAGNDGNTEPVLFPAAYPGVIAVGASTTSGVLANFSNTGPEIAVIAPGVLTYTTSADGVNPDTYTFTFGGTSGAAPHVTGIASLLLSLEPRLTPSRIRSILVQTASDVDPPGYDTLTGFGLVNAFRAVRAIPGALIPPPQDETVPMPNPFIARGLNRVTFRIPEDLGGTVVKVKIINAAGVPVRTITSNNIWDGKNDDGVSVASGVYFYELETTRGKSRNKVFLVR
ncbi:MAG: hypothetical protein A2901_02775 [Elusimicrobia bacterium RIFCSPLOWO2_01_FULL_54_10]|nr:MAG: hypothetical protein A2901_02775 [Elusimicrobia bacterium RIFCSPLOWO2_01_FULL_54_10]